MLRRCFIAILLSISTIAYSQVTRTEISIDFRLNRHDIDRQYSDNDQRLSEIVSFFQKVRQDSSVTILSVSFCGSASPEGSYEYNKKLAGLRLQSLEKLVRSEIEIPDSLIDRNDSYISWDYLSEQISRTDIPYKQEVLDIINEEDSEFVEYYGGNLIDSRIIKLQALDNGSVWKLLNDRYFAHMRNAYVVFLLHKDEFEAEIGDELVDVADELNTPDPLSLGNHQVDTLPLLQPLVQPEQVQIDPVPSRGLYVKTNTIGLSMLMTNIAAEVDIADHWSITVPVYYSALDYFVTTIRFRTLMVQPELRYWFADDNQGFFAGAHFGAAQYNVAVNGDTRYQDHDGTSPALGGGISAGYRMPLSDANRWFIEFTLGAGVYHLHYDTFYNIDNGKLFGTHKRTYFGPDNAAVTIAYRFNLNQRKR